MAFQLSRCLRARSLTLLALALPVSAAATGCAEPEPGKAVEHVAISASPIVNGQPDTTHPAVVAVLGPNFSCSGTIVQVKNGHGYVLTAGHCCPQGNFPVKVVMGTNYQSGQQFNVVAGSVARDSCYGDCPGSTDDVCMLQFNGATGATPVIPVMTPATDQLVIGESLTYVGYGSTPAPNSVRNFVAKGIATLDNYFISYDNPAVSGTCSGDSGGPAIASTPMGDEVAGVTSYGDQNCTQEGFSIRTSSVYTNFLQPYLADMALPMFACPVTTDCNVCAQQSENLSCTGTCVNVTKACLNDTACNALVNCYQGCGTIACQNGCNTTNVGGLQKYEAINACICAGSCSSVCAAGLCSVAQCGIYPSSSPATCKTCAENKCCAEAWTCSTDAKCRACFNKNPPASCMTNASALAYYQCVNTQCGTTGCVLANPANATGSSSATTTTSATGSGGTGGASSTTGATTGSSTGTGGAGGSSSSGCSCSTADEGSRAPLDLGVAALGAMVLFRRRRRARI